MKLRWSQKKGNIGLEFLEKESKTYLNLACSALGLPFWNLIMMLLFGKEKFCLGTALLEETANLKELRKNDFNKNLKQTIRSQNL